jgi:O-methyltransferase domain/Dimerisation domain
LTLSELDPVHVLDIITGRWRSQVMHAGVALGVFEHLSDRVSRKAGYLASTIGADPTLLYRLLRALSSVGLLREDGEAGFSITAGGRILRADHPQSLRAMALLEEGPVHYATWRHLPEMIRSGVQDGFRYEFGMTLFEYLGQNSSYAATFYDATSSYSAAEAAAIRRTLSGRLLEPLLFCDVGGGYGYLLAEMLQERPNSSGIVFDLPQVAANQEQHVTKSEILGGRCSHLSGDMFVSVPPADIYLLKHIIHDWNDGECRRILSVIREAAKPTSRLMIYEWIVSEVETPNFAKLVDIHMLCVCGGRQRTPNEFEQMLSASGWRIERIGPVAGSPLGMIEAVTSPPISG